MSQRQIMTVVIETKLGEAVITPTRVGDLILNDMEGTAESVQVFEVEQVLATLPQEGDKFTTKPGDLARAAEPKHRYTVQYGGRFALSSRYCVWDGEEERVVYQNNSKSSVIAEAQRMNEFDPVDGSEQTYARQTQANKEDGNA